MVDWTWIAFMIVGVGVWLIVTVFRKAEEERQRNLPRPRNAEGRRPATDLDRFLEEARRRREAGPVAAPPKPAETPWALPVERPSPKRMREVRPLRPAPPSDRPPAFVPSVRRGASEPRPVLPSAPPAPALRPAPVVLELVPDDEPAAPALPAAVPAPQPAAVPKAVVPARPAPRLSPALQQLSGLLRRPETVGTAFVLGVVFGPPVSRRFQ